MTLDEVFRKFPWLRAKPRRSWAIWLCVDHNQRHKEAPPITALLCCGIGTAYARKIRSDLINRGVIRPRMSVVMAWEAMQNGKVKP